MRLAFVIISLTVIAVALIHIRRTELAARCEIQRLQLEQVTLRRTMWDQQVRMGHLTAPSEVHRRAEQMALDLVTPEPAQTHLAIETDYSRWKR